MARRRPRWRGAVAAAVALAGAGLWQGSGTLLLAATLPLGYLAYGAASTAAVPDDLVVTRSIDPSTAPPGRPVSVSLTVRNESGRPLSDVRVVDGVPTDLAVLDGSPRGGETLAAGEAFTLDYTVVARRGEHDFDSPRVRVRGTGAGAVATAARPPVGDDRLVCRLDADAPPLSDRGSDRVGQLATDEPGDGSAFHSTREYRRGDDAGRIDWRGYAKRGTLATVNYERWVSTAVVFVLDARAPSRVAAGPGRPSAVELGGYATTRALASLLRAGHRVGVAVVGVDGDGPAGLAWLEPGEGRDHRARALSLLESAVDAAASGNDRETETDETADAERQFRKVLDLAGPRTQLVAVSPLLDDEPVRAVETWAAVDRPLTVLSPDVTAANTVSGQYEQVRRRTRLARCQTGGARAIDWRRGTPLALILESAFAVEARRPDGRVRPGGGG
ncbi:DUF58 domain-containing protein [Haloarcula salina]|uniref:DUF58 domain-containing protein n=1 Tax=Haloarcula salina TaxID=1429914 RepID=UPI003C7054C6